MISLLLPTRNRPDNLIRFSESAWSTCDNRDDIEIIAYIDSDDNSYDDQVPDGVKVIRGPRIVLSEMWNRCYHMANGPVFGHMGDDIIFRTQGWDTQVEDAFNEYEDKIVFVHGDDGGGNGQNFGTHGFIHDNWVKAVGYFVPPYFSSDYNDTWLNDVANMLGRRKYVDVLTEHMHPAFGKGPMDVTHEERLTRHRTDGVDAMYANKAEERIQDSNKLREVMK